jgi:hypothetical protein
MKRLCLTLSVLALSVAALSARPLEDHAAHDCPVYFIVAEWPGLIFHGDSYVLPLTDPKDIAQARRLIAEGPEIGSAIAGARIAAGADGINRDYLAPDAPAWSWHVTEFLGFTDSTLEILDGWPGYVEHDVEEWIRMTDGMIGFWAYTVIAELGAQPGAQAAASTARRR